MERTENPWQREEDREDIDIVQIFEEEEEEESNGGLEVRERRKKRENGGGVVIRETNGGLHEKVEEKDRETETSVYFDSEKGSNLQNGAKKDLNNGAEFAAIILPEIINKAEIFRADFPKIISPKIINKTEILPAENGSNSNSKPNSPQITNNNGSSNNNIINLNGNIKDEKNYDLEKLLEEQDTYDLYCPNCNSCITKRVILKKRKRIVKDVKSELQIRPDKIQNLGIINNNDSLNEPLLNNQDEDEREQHILFKCLSCFTFFIPKECGFNIFDICGGNSQSQTSQIRDVQNIVNTQTKEEVQNVISTKEEVQNVILTKEEVKTVTSAESKGVIKSSINAQNSNQISNNNWFFDLFGSNQNKPINNKTEDPSFSHWQNKTTSTKTETVKNEETLIISNEASRNTSTITSESEIEEIESTGTKNQNGKFHDISFIGKQDQIQVVNSISVTTTIEEKRNDIQINEESNITNIKGSNIPQTQMKTPKGNYQQETLINPKPVIPVQNETIITILEEGPRIRPRNCSFCPGINNWDILKPIVYGGLIETITSLSIVSSASASGASTLTILLIGVAALVGGFVLILHDLMELKRAQDEAGDLNHNELGRYWALLGRKGHFGLHASVAIISYIFFGLLPPLIYGFTFRKTDASEYKLIAVGLSAIICVAILAIGKAHVRPQRNYFTAVVYYVAICVASSGLAYATGILLEKLMGSLGGFGEGFLVGRFLI